MRAREKFCSFIRRASWPAMTLGAAGVGVAGASWLAAPDSGEAGVTAHNQPNFSHLGRYTHSSSDCTDGGVNPITLVFTSDTIPISPQFIREHAAQGSHGWFINHEGAPQYFLDHTACQLADDQSADASGLGDRYHMRYNLTDFGGSAEFIPVHGYHIPASPHQEEFMYPSECFPPTHAVWDMTEVEGGGFNSARNYVSELWVSANDGHSLGEVQQWGNTQAFEQCDGGLVWSDGFVWIIDSVPPNPSPNPLAGLGKGVFGV